jgi:hypothetical protein
MVKNFSRSGMRVILNTPDIDDEYGVEIGIQRPDYNETIFTTSSVAWKKCFEGKCEVGLKFNNFPVQAKAAFLEYGYKRWLKEKSRRA